MKRKTLLRIALLLATSVLASPQALASSWHVFVKASNNNNVFFFDADTVVRQRDTVTLWVKYVRTVEAEKDGSWATAMKTIITCSKRVTQTTTYSMYDKNGAFINSIPGSPALMDVEPDSVMEQIVKVACAPDFPKGKADESHQQVANNDIFALARAWATFVESKKDQAPK